MAEIAAPVAGQYAQEGQRREAAQLGMWLFLATEAMLFGGIFLALIVYRIVHPAAVAAAARHFDMWLGGLNTAVLLTSSFTMALAVEAARGGRARSTSRLLAATIGLGLLFLAIKAVEYAEDIAGGVVPGTVPTAAAGSGPGEIYVNLYFVATGLHAIHLAIGIVLVACVALAVRRGRLVLPRRESVVATTGLYWHFVDMVWIFLYPALYLIGRAAP